MQTAVIAFASSQHAQHKSSRSADGSSSMVGVQPQGGGATKRLCRPSTITNTIAGGSTQARMWTPSRASTEAAAAAAEAEAGGQRLQHRRPPAENSAASARHQKSRGVLPALRRSSSGGGGGGGGRHGEYGGCGVTRDDGSGAGPAVEDESTKALRESGRSLGVAAGNLRGGHCGPVTCLIALSEPANDNDDSADDSAAGAGSSPTRSSSRSGSLGYGSVWAGRKAISTRATNTGEPQRPRRRRQRRQRRAKQVASGGEDGKVVVWDLHSTKQVKTLNGHNSKPIFSLANLPQPNGRHALLASGSEREIILWNVDTGTEIRRLLGHTTYVWGLAEIAILAGGPSCLASVSADKSVRVWCTESRRCDFGDCISVAAEEHRDSVYCIAILPPFPPNTRMNNGRAPPLLMATGSADKQILIWNVTKAHIGAAGMIRSLRGHRGAVTAVAGLGPTLLASAADDKSVRIWNVLSNAAALHVLSEHVQILAAIPDVGMLRPVLLTAPVASVTVAPSPYGRPAATLTPPSSSSPGRRRGKKDLGDRATSTTTTAAASTTSTAASTATITTGTRTAAKRGKRRVVGGGARRCWYNGTRSDGGGVGSGDGEGDDGPSIWSTQPSVRGSSARSYRKLSSLSPHVGGVVSMMVVCDSERVIAFCGTGVGEIIMWGPSLEPLGQGLFASLFQSAERAKTAGVPSSSTLSELKYGKGFANAKPSRASSPFDCL